jgi:hypothetical protein
MGPSVVLWIGIPLLIFGLWWVNKQYDWDTGEDYAI